VAIDMNPAALALAEANAARNLREPRQLQLRSLDWGDAAACSRLHKEFGPFDAIVISDGVLALPPSGPMWHTGRDAEDLASPPGPLLDATRLLGAGGADVILVVAERAGDVAETARALLDRRRWLEMVSLPQDLVTADGSTAVTVFRFRWRREAGAGGENVRRLWAAM